MLLRFTLKNMFEKPLRLFVLLLCVTVASFAGCLAIDIGGTLKNIMTEMMSEMLGSVDFFISTDKKLTDECFAGCPDANILYVQNASSREDKRDESLYTYVISENVTLWSFDDPQKAQQIGLLAENVTLKENEAAITIRYSEKYGYKVGDKITLTGRDKQEFTVTVCSLFKGKGLFDSGSGLTMIVPKAVTARINGIEEFGDAMIDVADDTQRGAFKEQFLENNPDGDITDLFIGKDLDKTINNVTAVCAMIFVLTFLLVIFVTASFTEKIVQERMSVIGTLRSIGMSRRKTTCILLLENLCYGLIGSAAGCGLYALIRPLWSKMMMTSDVITASADQLAGKVSPLLYPAVILSAVLIEMIIPLSAVIGAVRTPIRDIIFANRDTEYQVSKKRTVLGAGMIAAGLVCGFLTKNLACNIAAVLLITVGMAFSVQAVIRFVTAKFSAFFEKRGMPVAEFAAEEAGSKKTNMGNAVLIVTTIIAASAIFLLGADMLYWANRPAYDADLVITDFEERKKAKDLDFIHELKGVDEAVFIYDDYDAVKPGKFEQENDLFVLSSEDMAHVIALPQTDMLPGAGDLPDTLGYDEVLMDRVIADRYKMKPGDTKELTFRCDGLVPVTREVHLNGYASTQSFTDGGSIVISPELYRMLYGTKPVSILIRSSDPETAKDAADFAITDSVKIMDRAEYTAERQKDSRTMRLGLYAVIAAALFLTMIGISGNQLVGFESRRKEFALLHSTAMTRKQIARLIFLENGFSFGIAVLLAVLCSIPVTMLIQRVFNTAGMGLTLTIRIRPMLGFLAVIWVIIMLTARTPIRRLKRMNTANEIKYE